MPLIRQLLCSALCSSSPDLLRQVPELREGSFWESASCYWDQCSSNGTIPKSPKSWVSNGFLIVGGRVF